MSAMKSLVVVAAAATSLAACGSSSPGSGTGTAASSNANKALAFAQCMRSHGVSNFPDPSSGRINLQVQRRPSGTSVNGVQVNAPAFQSAMKSCRADLPNGGKPAPPSESQRKAALQFAQCMRSHGVPNFPDPQLSGNGVIIKGAGGLQPDSPAFKSAQQACQPLMQKMFKQGPAAAG